MIHPFFSIRSVSVDEHSANLVPTNCQLIEKLDHAWAEGTVDAPCRFGEALLTAASHYALEPQLSRFKQLASLGSKSDAETRFDCD